MTEKRFIAMDSGVRARRLALLDRCDSFDRNQQNNNAINKRQDLTQRIGSDGRTWLRLLAFGNN